MENEAKNSGGVAELSPRPALDSTKQRLIRALAKCLDVEISVECDTCKAGESVSSTTKSEAARTLIDLGWGIDSFGCAACSLHKIQTHLSEKRRLRRNPSEGFAALNPKCLFERNQ